MAILIRWGGSNDQSAWIEHPRDLKHIGYPIPPMQPVASWAFTLDKFTELCNADQFGGAIEWLCAEYCYARTSDVPSGKLTAFRTWVRRNFTSRPPMLHGADTWTDDGTVLPYGGM
ncbi:MAG: hypothetical protein QM756_26560 [Polyangiaceae bacterium]